VTGSTAAYLGDPAFYTGPGVGLFPISPNVFTGRDVQYLKRKYTDSETQPVTTHRNFDTAIVLNSSHYYYFFVYSHYTGQRFPTFYVRDPKVANCM